ncbi:hypothetical protein [Acinetobacter calcoaceticus]|uniref:hypothetical protein n=1 Tax=Acinetobacter calcoaceticus TaxID=471 RepID=UPI00300A187C
MEDLLEQYKSAYKDSADLEETYVVNIQNKEINGFLYTVVDNMLVIEIPEVNFLISSDGVENEIDLIYEGNIVGELNLIDKNKKMSNTSELNKSKLIYCIYSIYNRNFDCTGNFKKNFLLVKDSFSEKYINDYLITSSFWGGFSHVERDFVFQPSISSIELPSQFKFPTSHNLDLSFSSLFSSNPLEKFLKDYHQLELLFNLIIIKKVQTISISELNRINEIYKDLRKSEMDSLVYIIENFIDNDEVYLKIIIDTFKSNEALCENFLQNYSKESNPLGESKKWEKFKLFVDKADQDNCISIDDFFNTAIHKDIAFAQSGKKEEFIKNIKKINAYWIYRIRCSIAHTKLGEFIFEYNQENHEFIYKYANNLIKRTIICIFSNQNFKSLFDS